MLRRVLVLLISWNALLAGPWEDFREGAARRSPHRWTLAMPSPRVDPAALLGDELYQKLAAEPDWALDLLNADQASDLEATLGARWALVAPGGAVAGSGRDRPTGAVLLDAMHGAGFPARFEAREAFLHDHPGQGEARLEELAFQVRLLRTRLASLDAQGKVRVGAWHPERGQVSDARIALAGPDGPEQASGLFRGVEAALAGLAKVPDWTREADELVSRICPYDLGQSASLRGLFGSLIPAAERAAAEDPEDEALLRLLMEVLDMAGELPSSFAPFQVPPGDVWPTPQGLGHILDPYRRRRDWEGELRILAGLTPEGPPQPLDRHGWEAFLHLRAALDASRAAACASMGSLDEARAALDAARSWGKASAAETTFLRRGVLAASGDAAAWRRLLAQTAGAPLPPAPPMPAQPGPLTLTLLGRPGWLVPWSRLRDAPELAAWAPSELRWDIADEKAHQAMRQRFGWEPGPRWALLRGGTPLASGTSCPTPQALAAVLAGHGRPLLERLGEAIERDPANLALRRARFHALLLRMPDARWEPVLAEDAVRAALAPPFSEADPFRPDPGLWSAAAQQVLPDLEARLRAWPGDSGFWEAWIAWARFHPQRPSPLALVRSLPHWAPAGDWRASLPFAVHRAVAAEMRRAQDFREMRDWFQELWDGLDHRPLKDLRPWERTWFQERRAEEETAVFQPLREALRALGMTGQLLDLERTFGAMVGRTAPRR